MTDGWSSPVEPGGPEQGQPGQGQSGPPQGPPPGPPPGAPPGWGAPPNQPPGWGAPAPGAPHGYGPPGSFANQPPGYGGQYGGGYGTPPGGGYGGPPGGPAPGYGAPPGGYGEQPGYGAGAFGTAPGDQGAGTQAGYGAQPGQPGYGGGYGGYGQPGGQWGQQTWGRAAPEPGIVPLRPLALGEILDGGFAVVRKYPRVTLGLAAIITTITQVIAFLTQLPLILDDGFTDPDSFAGFNFAQILSWMISATGLVVLAGMLTSVMGDAVLGRGTTIGETWAKVRPKFWALIGAGILGAVVPFVGLVFCIIPGAFMWGAWAFLTPVVVLERSGVIEATRRSWRLAVPDFWRVWGIRALSVVIATVLQWVIVLPISMLAVGAAFVEGSGDLTLVPMILITLAGIVAGTITAPFSSGVLALLYIDRRMRAEGLDVTLAQAAQAGPA